MDNLNTYQKKVNNRILKYVDNKKIADYTVFLEKIIQGEIACSSGLNTSSYLVGCARVLKEKRTKRKTVFNTGEILVTEKTDPSNVPIMIRSTAIITNVGGVTSHAAVECRRMKIPCLINTDKATEMIRDQEIILIQMDTDDNEIASVFRMNNPSVKIII